MNGRDDDTGCHIPLLAFNPAMVQNVKLCVCVCVCILICLHCVPVCGCALQGDVLLNRR